MERRLAAILVADVVGYSRLMGEDEARTHAGLQAHRRELIDPKITEHHGRIVKLTGDGALVEFASVVNAVECAVGIQRAMAERNTDVPEDRRMEFRIGINLGDIIVEEDDIYGDGVNVAARLEGLAEPGGICVSVGVYDQVRNRVDASFEDMGKQKVKNIDKPVQVWRWAADTLRSEMESEPLSLLNKPLIAVLPFDNMSGDAEQEFLADGFTEEIITSLGRFRSISVIARNSSFSYKGKSADVRSIAKELGARYLVEGSIRRARHRIRLTVQLIDAKKGDHIWAEHYDRELKDTFAVQDEIAQTISATIIPEISHVEQESARRKPPRSLSAWEWYHRGLWHLYRFTLEGMLEARRLFQRALDLDPNFAAAHSGIAYTLFQECWYSESDDKAEILDRALAAAQTSAAIDDQDAFAHFVLGRIQARRGQRGIALAEAKKSINLNPSFASGYFGLGEVLLQHYKFEEALKMFDAAARLSPRDPHAWTFIHHQACSLLGLKRYEEAVGAERRALLSPNAGFYPYLPLISALGHLGRLEEAKYAIEQLHNLHPGYACATARRLYNELRCTRDFGEHVIDGLRKAGLPD